ncbi:hypothetical protein [Agrobacterium sp. CG674]
MTTPTTADPATAATVYQVKDFIDAQLLRRDQAINGNDLSSAMMEQAAMFSHYGVLAAEASKQVDVVKMLLENTEAAVYQLERAAANQAAVEAAATKSPVEKVTEAMLEKKIARHPRVIAMKKALNDAKRIEATGKIAVESFRHRRDMLVQLGLISREEMKGELKIGVANAREEATKIQGERALSAIRNRHTTDE